MAMADASTRSLEERIKNLELQNRQQESWFYASKKETLKVAPLGVGLGDLPIGGPEVRMMLNLYFNFPAKTRKNYSLDNLY